MIQCSQRGRIMEQLHQEKGSKTKALYLQIKEIYRKKILNGELQLGDKIESELEIQKNIMYRVLQHDRQFWIWKKKEW